jgi:hypothetical protein
MLLDQMQVAIKQDNLGADPKRLKYTEVSQYRAHQLERQSHNCALCGEAVIDDAVLDHDHRSGLIRKVLHRGCNALLGKIENNLARNRMTPERLAVWSQRLVEYISIDHTNIIHPTHKVRRKKS